MTTTNKKNNILPASFRDPSGFVFFYKEKIFRQVNKIYKKHYNYLLNSGLYRKLVDKKLLIPHEEIENSEMLSLGGYKIIAPEPIPFISYPYEWCFSGLKDAALATLTIQKYALEKGMILKDSSAYNIQFYKGRPVMIDTLSFEIYRECEPWVAYRQFCQHFLAPLALMSYCDIRLNGLLRNYIDGVPLDLASKLLPLKSHLKFPLLTHLHLHARSQKHYADKPVTDKRVKISKQALIALINNLINSLQKLKPKKENSEWGDYYADTNYSEAAFKYKQELISDWLKQVKTQTVWDLGANTGEFSQLATKQNIFTIAFDIDPVAVEKNYLASRASNNRLMLPLLLDLTNPSPGIGWTNRERMALEERGPADMNLALALIHHLAISNNLPFPRIAEYLRRLGRNLIIEYVPKEDSNAQRLLRSREDIFSDYTQENFENSFKNYYHIKKSTKIKESERTLYFMEGK